MHTFYDNLGLWTALFGLVVTLVALVCVHLYATNKSFKKRYLAYMQPGSIESFCVGNKSLLRKTHHEDTFGHRVVAQVGTPILYVFGVPGAGKSSFINAMCWIFRKEEGTHTNAPVGESGGHVTHSASIYDLYQKASNTLKDLVLPRLVDFPGFAAALLEHKESCQKIANSTMALTQGELLTKADYNFILQMDKAPATTRSIYERVAQEPRKYPKASGVTFVIPADQPLAQPLLHIAGGYRAADIPVIFIITKAEGVAEQEKQKLVQRLKQHSEVIHIMDARPGGTSEEAIREIWYSIFAACYAVPLLQ